MEASEFDLKDVKNIPPLKGASILHFDLQSGISSLAKVSACCFQGILG